MEITGGNRHSNNFDIIRFLAAFIVIIKHSNILLGKPPYWISSQDLPFLGVPIFFIISGYLISISAVRSKNSLDFLWKRTLRIIPGLAIALLFTVFLIGPFMASVEPLQYFSNSETYRHLLTVFLYKLEVQIPFVFSDNIVSAVNGSLWTLKYEFTCYIAILLLVLFKIHKYKFVVFALFVLSLAFRIYLGDKFYIYNYRNPYVLNHNIMFLVQWGFYFASGVVFFLFKDKIPLKASILIIASTVYALLIWQAPELIKYYQYLYIPYAVFYLSFIPGRTNNFGKYGDFSYGLYIYAFPVQQLIIAVSNQNLNPMVLTIYAGILTLGLSILSWKFIEKPMLKYKNVFSQGLKLPF
jgi:peptidoglycan/LPS O-acetylase OafA/YrhL